MNRRQVRMRFVVLLLVLAPLPLRWVLPLRASASQKTTPVTWVTVRDDTFNTAGLPAGWHLRDGRGKPGYYLPSHVTVPGDGYMHILFSYDPSVSGWAMGAATLPSTDIGGGQNFQITTRFRVIPCSGSCGSGNTRVATHRNMPLLYPDTPTGCSIPDNGEMDVNEEDGQPPTAARLQSYFHYCSSTGTNVSVANYDYSTVDLTQFHVFRYVKVGLTYQVFIDNMTTPVWTYVGNATTMPTVARHLGFQMNCLDNHYNGSFHKSCPSGTSGQEEWLIDYVQVDVPQ